MVEKQVVVKRISAELWQRLKIQAAVEGRTLQMLIADAIEQYLDKDAA